MQHAGVVVGLTLSVVAGAIVLLALVAAALRRRHPRWAAAMLTLGIPAAGLLAYRPLLDKSPLSDLPHDVVQRLWWGAAGLAVLLAIVRGLCGGARPWLRRGAMLAAAILLPAAVLAFAFLPFRPADTSTVQFLARPLGLMLLAIVGGWLLLEPMAVRSPGAAVPLVMGFLSAGVGGLILMSDSTAPGMSVAVVGASTAGVLLAAWAAHLASRRVVLPVSAAGGAVVMWLTLLSGLMCFCCVDSDTVPTANLLILAAAPLLAWTPEIPAVHRWKPWRRELLRAALVAGPVILALARAYVVFRRDSDNDLSWLPTALAAV